MDEQEAERTVQGAPFRWVRRNIGAMAVAVVFVLLVLPQINPFEGLNQYLTVVQRFNRWVVGRLEGLFANWGYHVVFIGVLLENSMFLGLFVPGSILLILAGLSAENGSIELWLVLVLAVIATIIGDTISYGIGRLGWTKALERTGMGATIAKVRVRMESHSTWLILAYHFAGYSRVVGPTAAGLFQIPYRRWAPLDYAGATLWVFTFTMLGVALGLAGVEFKDTKTVTRLVELLLFGLLIGGVILVYTRATRASKAADAGGLSSRHPSVVPVEDE